MTILPPTLQRFIRTAVLPATLLLAALPVGAGAPGEPPAPAPAGADDAAPAKDPNRHVRDGLVIQFSLAKLGGSGALQEGDFAEARFAMTDATSGLPVPGLKPAVWMDMAGVVGGRAGESKECKDKVALYLQGTVGIRPMIDLNSYYLLTLNKDASISVVDPVVSMTGSTSLFATIILKRPGADWTKSADERRLFVSMPKAGEVSVIDAEQFKVVETVPAGKVPTRVRLQADGRYLWVGNDAEAAAESGVTVIDTETSKPVGFVATGRGHHEIALSAGDRHAFVSNRTDGTISVIDPGRLEITTRIKAAPGLGPLRFSMDGRWGFAVNPAERAVFVVDAAQNELVHEIPMGGEPYQVTFTRAFAYVRLLDSEQVKMVNLLSVGAGKKPIVQGFAAGNGAPRLAGDLSLADTVSPASTDAAVFVAHPADNNTYFYMEGMNAPMGSYAGYGHTVRAATVVDRSLKEVEPGVFASKVRIPVAGRYDVAFLLDNPRILHCFGAEAAVNVQLRKSFGTLTAVFEPPEPATAGETVPLKLKLTDPATGQPRTGIGDVTVLYHRVPGGPKQTAVASEADSGLYEATLLVPHAGTYYAFIAIPSLALIPRDLPFQSIIVQEAPEQARKASR